MPAINVNGYNNTFSAFVQFAQERVNAGEKKAIANIETTPLGKRKIVASLNRRPPVRWARFYDFAVDMKGLTFLD